MLAFLKLFLKFYLADTPHRRNASILEVGSEPVSYTHLIRTVVVLVFSWFMVLMTGTWDGIMQIDGRTLLFLILSGLATGASWLCYFRALQNGNINKVVPIDKSSTILSILLALIFLHEGVTLAKIVSVVLIGSGTMMMITKKDIETDSERKSGGWLIYAVLSAVFASLTSVLGKRCV